MKSAGNRLNYGQLMQKAMRRVMADVLGEVADGGLPGEHHFYITFETDHPGVDIPDWLCDQYPEEMTIVIQEWFDDLTVTPDRFSIVLNFSNAPQMMVIPFEAVRTFVDPSVRFGLKFDAHEAGEGEIDALLPEDAAEETEADSPEAPASDSGKKPEPPGGADIVSLDHFRKS